MMTSAAVILTTAMTTVTRYLIALTAIGTLSPSKANPCYTAQTGATQAGQNRGQTRGPRGRSAGRVWGAVPRCLPGCSSAVGNIRRASSGARNRYLLRNECLADVLV